MCVRLRLILPPPPPPPPPPDSAGEYEVPYQGLVPPDPSFEEMKRCVVVERRQPTIPAWWGQDDVRTLSTVVHKLYSHCLSVYDFDDLYLFLSMVFRPEFESLVKQDAIGKGTSRGAEWCKFQLRSTFLLGVMSAQRN